MKYRKAVVTGGAGFIGSHVTRKLLELGIETIVIDDLSTGREENLPKEAKLVVADILDYKALNKTLEGADIVFHQAAKVTIRNSFADFYRDAEVNIMGTVGVLKAMAENKVKKIVYASSMAVYGKNPLPIPEDGILDPISPYGVGKLASEKYCLLMAKSNGFDAVCLRYFNTYGPKQTFTPYVGVITIFINQLLKNQTPIIFGDGEQTRDFIHVDNIVEANILAMDKDTRAGTYNVGTGKGATVNEIADLLIRKMNSEIKPKYQIPPPPGEPADSVACIRKAGEDLGFAPSFKLEDKIDEVIDWIRETNEYSSIRTL